LWKWLGGASGIGLAAAKILSSLGAKVHIFDITPLENADADSGPDLIFQTCDVTSWVELRSAFQSVGHIDMVFANAGLGETKNYFSDTLDNDSNLQEPPSTLIDVNLKGMLYTIKLAWFAVKQQKSGGSIVLTTSATAYVPWQSLAVYTSVKLAASTLLVAHHAEQRLISTIISAHRNRPVPTVPPHLRQHHHQRHRAWGYHH